MAILTLRAKSSKDARRKAKKMSPQFTITKVKKVKVDKKEPLFRTESGKPFRVTMRLKKR